jgi:acetyltransferase-like isoleucine patch superfamily enzyme
MEDRRMKSDWKDQWKFALKGHASLVDLHASLRDEIMHQWNRCLPFNEELFDRWEKARFLGFGKGSSIYDSSVVIGDVRMGEHTWVGPFTILDGSGGLSIGKYCSLSSGVQIYTHDTVKWSLSGGSQDYEYGPVTIGDCSYIGPLSVITKGSTIGIHCLIGAHSLVNAPVPDYSIAVGCPCRTVGEVKLDGNGGVELVFFPGQQ